MYLRPFKIPFTLVVISAQPLRYMHQRSDRPYTGRVQARLPDFKRKETKKIYTIPSMWDMFTRRDDQEEHKLAKLHDIPGWCAYVGFKIAFFDHTVA
jgi:hypothetical protein